MVSCGVGHRFSSDASLLWLWHRPAAAAPIQPLAWELPYAASATLKSKNKQKTQKTTAPPTVYLHIKKHFKSCFSTLMSINRRMDREGMVHIYNGILFGHKKNETMPFAAAWMDLEIITVSGEVSQIKTNIICYHLYVESNIIIKKELIYKTETNLQISKPILWLPQVTPLRVGRN